MGQTSVGMIQKRGARNMERFCCQAIVISRVDFGESDRIVTLLSADRGCISAFARGARNSKKRFQGLLEPGNLLQATLTTSRGSLHTLLEASLIDGHDVLRRDLGAMSRAACACELSKELCRDSMDSQSMFTLLSAFLEGSASPEDLMCFELGALGVSGFRPGLERCAICGASDGVDLRFDSHHGGRLCGRCARARGSRISSESLHLLADIQSGRPEAGLLASSRARAEAREVLTGYVLHQMGHRLKSYDFLEQMGLDI